MGSNFKLDRRTFIVGGLLSSLSLMGMALTEGETAETDPQLPAGRLGDLDENTIFDVCIIGSGFAGAVLGDALVKDGIKTVILESGPDPRGKSTDPRFHQLNAFRSIGPLEYPVTSSRFRGVGGTSWMWGGICTRLHPGNFDESNEKFAGGSWPISYEELQPFYKRAEATLRVRGGKRSEYHPPRTVGYPLPPDRDVSPLETMLARAGIVVSDMPFSTSIKNKPSMFSDRWGARVLMTDSHLPEFQKSTQGTLISGGTVTRLLVDDAGQVGGAEVKDLERNVKILRARVYVVACGGLESPRLLLLSRSGSFPKGIGNNHDLVGRFFTDHRPAVFVGRIALDWSTFNFYALKGFSYQFFDKFKKLGAGGVRLGFDLEGAVDKSDFSEGRIRYALSRVFKRQLEITIGSEMKPSPENRVTLDREAKDYFGNPIGNLFLKEAEEDSRIVDSAKKIVHKIYADLGVPKVEELPRTKWGHHHVGTCRMGDDPRSSVVDRNLQVHGTKNLFVAGSAPFVTSGNAHPTLTLTALSLRLGDFLGTRLRAGVFATVNQRVR